MAEATGKYRGSKGYLLVYGELIQAARYRGLTTYQAIAKIMDLPLSGSHMGKEVGQMVGEISEDEIKQGRPMLSAVVVGVSGVPGGGFYALAKGLGRLQEDSAQGQHSFWEQERDAVYEAWKREFKT